jgi:glycosyltransferase involved in cell wall biosynthesis
MKIGIYNRWLYVLGGGERLTLDIAKALAEQHEVHVISHHRVNRSDVETRLHIDMTNVQFDIWPNLPDEELSPWTEYYELFINASHIGFVPSKAKASVLLVYFPVWSGNCWWQPVLSWLVQLLLRRKLIMIDYLEGFADTPLGRTLRGKGRLSLLIPPLLESLRFRITLAQTQAKLQLRFEGKPLTPIRIWLSDKDVTVYEFNITPTIPRRVLELEVNLIPSDEALFCFQAHNFRYWLYSLLFEKLIPGGWLRVKRIPPLKFRSILGAYTRIWAISQFVQRWVEIHWGVESDILYPAVDVDAFTPLRKYNIILSVGRFFAGGHNKKQLEMVKAFKQMCRKSLEGWELHLAGGLSPGPQHLRYLRRVREEAKGYPIFFHVNVPFRKLRELYGQAKIYWHASGYGEDINRHPNRFEHFGITTVEAMAAGCVPVIIGKAGQREIVMNGINGFLWQRLDELIMHTKQLIENPTLWGKMSQNARRRSRDFGKKAFIQRILALVSDLRVKEVT